MYLDLDWYKVQQNKDITLEAVANNEKLVQIFASEDKLNSLRAAKIGKEFGLNYILKGNGNEFEALKKSKDQFKIYHSNSLKRMMCLLKPSQSDGIERFCFGIKHQPILKC
jgi:hypothetical protein